MLFPLAWPNLCSASYISSIATLYICARIYTCKTYVHVPGCARLCGWAVCTCGSHRCTSGVFLYHSTLETVLSLNLKSSLTCLCYWLIISRKPPISTLSILDWMYGPALVFYMSVRDPQHWFPWLKGRQPNTWAISPCLPSMLYISKLAQGDYIQYSILE